MREVELWKSPSTGVAQSTSEESFKRTLDIFFEIKDRISLSFASISLLSLNVPRFQLFGIGDPMLLDTEEENGRKSESINEACKNTIRMTVHYFHELLDSLWFKLELHRNIQNSIQKIRNQQANFFEPNSRTQNPVASCNLCADRWLKFRLTSINSPLSIIWGTDHITSTWRWVMDILFPALEYEPNAQVRYCQVQQLSKWATMVIQ